jgi:RTX calcium-binding nonapeptide repeat (4 copies)
VILPGTGDDTAYGGGGADRIFDTAAGADTLNGEAGNDQIQAAGGDDTIDGGGALDAANDLNLLIAGSGDDDVAGGKGRDRVFLGTGDDTATTGEGRDVVQGGSGRDTINGGVDDDELDGGRGRDFLSGTDGDDLLLGGPGNDILLGSDGNDPPLRPPPARRAPCCPQAANLRDAPWVDRVTGSPRTPEGGSMFSSKTRLAYSTGSVTTTPTGATTPPGSRPPPSSGPSSRPTACRPDDSPSGNLLPRPAAAHALGPLGHDVRARARGVVDGLDEDPLALARLGQPEAPGELLAVQHERQVARFVAQHVDGPLVPDDHRAGSAAVPLVDALEVARVEVVVLDGHRQPPNRGIERRTLRDRPRAQHVAELQAQVEVQRRRVVQLHDEAGHQYSSWRRIHGSGGSPSLRPNGARSSSG